MESGVGVGVSRCDATMMDDEPTPPIRLGDLMQELHHSILLQLADSFSSLGACAQTCSLWRAVVPAIAKLHLAAKYLPNHVDCDVCPRPLRALAAAQRLADAVGILPVPPNTTWLDEWPLLRFAASRARAHIKGTIERFDGFDSAYLIDLSKPGGACSIENEVAQAYATSIAFKVDRGWNEQRAIEASLLASRCGGALSYCVQGDDDGERIRTPGHEPADAHFGASCWALCCALWERAWVDDAHVVAPPTFACLDGEFGLAQEDRGWEAIRGPGGEEAGTRFLARGFAFAHVGTETCFPDGRGFHVPVTGNVRVSYEHVASDVVRFISRPSTASARRSLILTDVDVYRLPPFVTVTLEAVWPRGTWAIEGLPHPASIDCKCFDCFIEY